VFRELDHSSQNQEQNMETYEQKIHFYYFGLKRTLITFLLRIREITSRT
jgi:hypothetical protein